MLNFYKLVDKILKNKIHKGDLSFIENINPFLIAQRNGSYIFEIRRIIFFIRKVLYFIYLLKRNNGSILFIGLNTKGDENESFLKMKINKLIEKKVTQNSNFVFIEKFKEGSLTNITSSSSLKSKFNGKWPNLVITFSKLSRNNLQEFFQYGIPLCSLINDEKMLQYIDYPLIGDSDSLQSVIFYLDLINYTLNKD